MSVTARRGFGSDNHSGAHPRILAAMTAANIGHAPSYGTDEWTKTWDSFVQSTFGREATSYFVFNGTAANVLAVGAFVQSFNSVLAAETSHIINDECGAAENLLGCRVIAVPSGDGKLTPESLKPFLTRSGDQHVSQPKVVTVTQPTEVGTIYSLEELATLGRFCREKNLILHIGGARLVNAATALGCTLSEITREADAVSLGGTKNGLVFGEAVVFLNRKANPDFRFLRKQAMQLPSKSRLIAAQFLEFLTTDLWQENSRTANRMAARLSEGLGKSPYVALTQKTQANGCFVKIPREMVAPLREHYFFYVWDEKTFECRLMTSWDTTPEDVDGFLGRLDELGARIKPNEVN